MKTGVRLGLLALLVLAGPAALLGCSGGVYAGAHQAPRNQERSPMAARVRDIIARKNHQKP